MLGLGHHFGIGLMRNDRSWRSRWGVVFFGSWEAEYLSPSDGHHTADRLDGRSVNTNVFMFGCDGIDDVVDRRLSLLLDKNG